MTLADILALRPADDADAATIHAAITEAMLQRTEQMRRAGEAHRLRTEGALHTGDRALLAAERDAQAARLAVDRLDAILPDLRRRLDAARGREALDALRQQAAALDGLAADVARWQAEGYSVIARLIGEGLHAERALIGAVAAFRDAVTAAYADPAVRAAGTLDGVALPIPTGPQPSLAFPNWKDGVAA